MIPFYLKKWYLDLISDDGVILYIYFIAARIAGIRWGNVSAHLTPADGKSIRSSINRRVALLDSSRSAACGRSFLANESGGSHVHLELPQLEIDLRYQSAGESWAPGEDGVLLRRNGQCLSWNVPAPAAAAEGVIRSDRQEWHVRGTGYQDIVEMTLPPWRLPIAELAWGRAHCGGHTVVFDRMRMIDGTCLQFAMLRRGIADPATEEFQEFAIEPDKSDPITVLRHESFTLHLAQRHILEQGAIAAGGEIKSRLLAKCLARSSGNPIEKKMAAEAELSIGGGVFRGWAIHERVSWRWA